MLKRDTRVQIFIVEGGEYILLKHHDIKRDLYFWGVPGGGREIGETDEEAAIREAFEETSLKIKLLPIKIEGVPLIKTSMYRRVVTFLAYPVEGEARVGFEPEPELQQYYRLVDIKWKGFYDDNDLDKITFNEIIPLRNIVDSNKFIKKKEFVICKIKDNIKNYLLVYNENKCRFGCIAQESRLELGKTKNFSEKVNCNLGFFLSENDGIQYKTDMFYIEIEENEDVDVRENEMWFNYEELSQIKLERNCKKVIEKLNKKV